MINQCVHDTILFRYQALVPGSVDSLYYRINSLVSSTECNVPYTLHFTALFAKADKIGKNNGGKTHISYCRGYGGHFTFPDHS